MPLCRIVRHGRDGNSCYIKDACGKVLELPKNKAHQYIDWLYTINGHNGSQLVLEIVNVYNHTHELL